MLSGRAFKNFLRHMFAIFGMALAAFVILLIVLSFVDDFSKVKDADKPNLLLLFGGLTF